MKKKIFNNNEVIVIDIKKLIIHSMSSVLYSTNKIDDLVISMKKYGQLTPILITNDFFVISGVRIYLAAKKLEWKTIKAIITYYPSSGVVKKMVSEKKQRRKTFQELFNEIETLKSRHKKKQDKTIRFNNDNSKMAA